MEPFHMLRDRRNDAMPRRLVKRARPVARSAKLRRLSPEDAADTIVTSLVLPRRLHEQVTMAALRLNCSLAQLARDALTEFLARHQAALEEARPC
jgi:hypothetical protein